MKNSKKDVLKTKYLSEASKQKTTIPNYIQSKQPLLKIEQICLLLNIQESHLRSLIFRDEIPVIRVGRLIRFDSTQIKDWLEEKNFQ
jgi:excisionase family DNA binding protein